MSISRCYSLSVLHVLGLFNNQTCLTYGHCLFRYLGLPVMVYIHGGGFREGAGSSYPGQHLATHGNVLVVTFNYRLAALGFLTTYDQESPGNYGLWDQNEALKWVKMNIGQFGGDASRITIFGQSSGGAAASMHMFSPHSEGLIQGVIAQSGTAYSPFGFLEGSSLLSLTHNLADNFNCLGNTSSLMMNCLRTIDASSLIAAPVPAAQWSPTIDGDFFPINITDNDVFVLTRSPSIHLMVGSLHHDAAANAGFGAAFQTLQQMRLIIASSAENYFRNSEAVAATIEYVYIDDEVKEDEDVRMKTGTDMLTDMFFRSPAVRLAEDFVK